MARTRSHSGFTLLESLVAASIFATVLLGIYTSTGGSLSSLARGAMAADIHRNARAALALPSRELRRAGYDPSNSGAPVIQGVSVTATLEPTRLRLVGDVDNDGVTDRVTYELNGSRQIIRTQERWDAGTASWIGATSALVAEGIDSLQFQYWDSANAPTTSATGVRRIRVAIQASETPPGATPQTFSIYTDVRLRIP